MPVNESGEATAGPGKGPGDDEIRVVLEDALGVVARGESDAGLLVRRVSEVVAARERALESHLAGVLAARERDARDHALRGTLASFVDLADAVDGLLDAAGEGAVRVAARSVDRRLDRAFADHGFERIQTEGAAYDARWHDAVAEREARDVAPGCIVEEIARGYRSGDYVLRPARVVVSRAGD